MKAVVVGSVQFSERVLTKLLSFKELNVVGVVSRSKSNFNADFRDLGPLARKHQIDSFSADQGTAQDMLSWVSRKEPDLVFVCGWSQLLDQTFLRIPKVGVIGYHPAALPRNRGRHPLIWAIVLGLAETASTFFWMDEGADSGDILSQSKIPISNEDDAGSLYKKVISTAMTQISNFVPTLLDGTALRIPQEHSQANHWRKRSPQDGQLDWRMSASALHNLVRALAHPYPGATFRWNSVETIVWKSQAVESLVQEEHLEPGKVLEVRDRSFRVKCNEGSLWVLEHTLQDIPEVGAYL